MLYLIVFIAVALDLLTGIAKAIITHTPRTSRAYRKTIVKCLQYFFAILSGSLLSRAAVFTGLSASVVQFFATGIAGFIIFIEVTSVFENLYAADSTSRFSQWFIAPILRILTFRLTHTLPDLEKKLEKPTQNTTNQPSQTSNS